MFIALWTTIQVVVVVVVVVEEGQTFGTSYDRPWCQTRKCIGCFVTTWIMTLPRLSADDVQQQRKIGS